MTIFTTGAFLRPQKVMMDDKEVWMWVVAEFIDDSYQDGDDCWPVELADSEKDLLEEIPDYLQ